MTEKLDTFYLIKTINRDGTRGYIIDRPEGITVVTDGLVSDIAQFKTEKEAQEFIKTRRLERSGVKAYVRTNHDFLKDADTKTIPGMSEVAEGMHILENTKGQKCFYDTKHEGYYFDDPDVGHCVWESKADVEKFVKAMGFAEETIIKKA